MKIIKLLIIILLIVSVSSEIIIAQENNDVEDVLQGFDEDEDDILSGFDDEETEVVESSEDSDRFWQLTGSLSLSPSFNIDHDPPPEVVSDAPLEVADYRGLTRLRLKINLDLEIWLPKSWKIVTKGGAFYDFAYLLKDRDDFTDEVLDNYEQEIELWDTYIQGSLLPNLDVRFGRQIINWSRSDNIRVLDVLNPLDLREPGMVNIEDLRLPLTMTRLDYLFGKWSLTAVAIHEIRFNKEPVYGSEFYPFSAPLPKEDKAAHGGKNTEFGVALTGIAILPGFDLSLHSARYFDDQAHLKLVQPHYPLAGLKRGHSLLTMFGASAALVRNSWLFKTEIAHFDGLEFLILDGLSLTTEKKSRLDLLFGIEYRGFSNTTISVDAVNRHLFDFESAMEKAPNYVLEDDFQLMMMFQRDFRRETLHFAAVASILGTEGKEGAFERFSLKYDWTDNISIIGGAVLYQAGNIFYQQANDNDRLFFEAKYSF